MASGPREGLTEGCRLGGGGKSTSAHEREQRHQLVHVHLSRSALERSCIPLHPTKPFIPVYTRALENSARAPALPGKFRF